MTSSHRDVSSARTRLPRTPWFLVMQCNIGREILLARFVQSVRRQSWQLNPIPNTSFNRLQALLFLCSHHPTIHYCNWQPKFIALIIFFFFLFTTFWTSMSSRRFSSTPTEFQLLPLNPCFVCFIWKLEAVVACGGWSMGG